MKIFGSQTYGVHAPGVCGYPVAPNREHESARVGSARAHVGSALVHVSHAARTGMRASVGAVKSVPTIMPMATMGAIGAVFGATLWGWKGLLVGLSIGAAAGFGASQLPDIT